MIYQQKEQIKYTQQNRGQASNKKASPFWAGLFFAEEKADSFK